jgi:protein arginine N-methyltransferase 1
MSNYSPADHWKMMADHVRGAAYEDALRAAVSPGAVVLDIGTGTGAFALLACVLGASRVYAVEHDESIEVARQLAATNGLSERIEFIRGFSTEISLPESVDVIVSDLRGVLPLHGRHLTSIADARRRFLRPGGILIPQRDTIWASVVEAPDLYHQLVTPWEHDSHGLVFDAARQLAVNRWSKVRITPDQLLADAGHWATVDYERVESPHVGGEVSFVIRRHGIGHGWCLWFDATLLGQLGFSGAPGGRDLIYGNGFFPWAEPVELNPQDVVSLSLSANLVGDDYVWRWGTTVREGGELGRVKASAQQSNFLAAAMSREVLGRGRTDAVVTVGEAGRIDRAILGHMSGELSIEEIAHRVAEEFGDRLTPETALSRVRDVSRRYAT